MTDVAHLAQDLRAEAHRAPPDIAELMRRAAAELVGRGAADPISLSDAATLPAPFPPPLPGDGDVHSPGQGDGVDHPAAAAERGRCRICKCTMDRACWIPRVSNAPPRTCWWADDTETLCDNPDCLATAEARLPDDQRPDPGPHHFDDCPYHSFDNCPHCGPQPGNERGA